MNNIVDPLLSTIEKIKIVNNRRLVIAGFRLVHLRMPNQLEYEYWFNLIKIETDVTKFLQELKSGESRGKPYLESIKIFSDLSNIEFVKISYKLYLGREPELEGQIYHEELLDNNKINRVNLVLKLVTSEEGIDYNLSIFNQIEIDGSNNKFTKKINKIISSKLINNLLSKNSVLNKNIKLSLIEINKRISKEM